MKEKIKYFIGKIHSIGFTHIFSASIINKLFSLLTNMIVIRVIDKEMYGSFSYAFNIISIIMIFSDMGTNMARFQYCCETDNENERKAISQFLFKIGFTSNLIFSFFTLVYTIIIPIPLKSAKYFIQSLALFPLFQFGYDNLSYYFRIHKDLKSYAYLSNFNMLFYFIFFGFGALLLGKYGLVSGKYLALIIPIIIGLKWKSKNNNGSYSISKEKKISMIKYGLLIILTNGASSVLHYFDTYFVGKIILDEAILADYKVATVLPNALAFIPTACITMIYPYFVERMNDPKWITRNTLKMQLLLSVPILLITLICYFFAPLIISILFGNNYLTIIPIFRVLIITFFISSVFRTIYGNILCILHLVKINFVLSIFECIINIITDIILIKNIGSIGAAYSTMIITIYSSLISGIVFFIYLKYKMKSSIIK